MRKVLRKEKSGYAVGLIFCLIGLILLVVVSWKAWLHLSGSQLVLSDLWSLLWTEPLDFAFGVEFKLMHFTILGTALFLGGMVMLLLSRKWFTLAGENVLLTCPYCKNHWRASRAKGWAECPHCRQFVQPQVKKTG